MLSSGGLRSSADSTVRPPVSPPRRHAQPPDYKTGKSYERYRQELQAWCEITDIHNKQRGIAVALSLLKEDESGIREKVFDELALDDLKADKGFNMLLTFLDERLKDDLTGEV